MNAFLLSSIILLVLSTMVAAETSSQYDWSGGRSGPYGEIVAEWDSTFVDADCVAWLENNQSLILTAEKFLISFNFGNVTSVCASDMNSDGNMDVIASSGSGEIAWWDNVNGSGTDWAEHFVGDNSTGLYSGIVIADIDGDGDTDVAGIHPENKTVQWWENVNGSGTDWNKRAVSSSVSASSLSASDVDKDGFTDLLVCDYFGGNVVWLKNCNGLGSNWSEYPVYDNLYGAISANAVDMDTDGDLDVLCASNATGKVVWLENTDGSGLNWTEHFAGWFDDPVSVRGGDINGNGFTDIVIAGRGIDWGTGGCVWWENCNGSGDSWIKHSINESLTYANSVSLCDINQDGNTDILCPFGGSSLLLWWERTGPSGESGIIHTVDYGSRTAAVCTGDINGDGNIDIVGGEFDLWKKLMWWDITEYISEGHLYSDILFHLNPVWQYINWDSTEPSGTSVTFRVRASESTSMMGGWSEELTSPCSLEGILAPGKHYFQYEATLQTTDSSRTPALHDVSVEWQSSAGIHGGVTADEPFSVATRSNPVIHNTEILFTLTESSLIVLKIIDISGRTVIEHSDSYASGNHEIVLDNLSNGTYIALLTSGGQTVNTRFVVLK